MKFIAVPILMLLLFVQTFSTWVTIIDFKIQQKYIAAKICENRNRPKMHCNGNCVLMKKMRQQEKEEQNVPGTVQIKIFSTVISSRTFFANLPSNLIMPSKAFLPLVNSGKSVDRSSPIFHPPAI